MFFFPPREYAVETHVEYIECNTVSKLQNLKSFNFKYHISQIPTCQPSHPPWQCCCKNFQLKYHVLTYTSEANLSVKIEKVYKCSASFNFLIECPPFYPSGPEATAVDELILQRTIVMK